MRKRSRGDGVAEKKRESKKKLGHNRVYGT